MGREDLESVAGGGVVGEYPEESGAIAASTIGDENNVKVNDNVKVQRQKPRAGAPAPHTAPASLGIELIREEILSTLLLKTLRRGVRAHFRH